MKVSLIERTFHVLKGSPKFDIFLVEGLIKFYKDFVLDFYDKIISGFCLVVINICVFVEIN